MVNRILILLFAVLSSYAVRAQVVLPGDVPTIEALIALHKKMAKAEKEALNMESGIAAEEIVVKNKSKNWNDVRTTLNTKLKNANSYLIMGMEATQATNELRQLILEYTKLTKDATKDLFKYPLAKWYYAKCTYTMAREIKSIEKQLTALAASNNSILYASMEDKLTMISSIHYSAARMRNLVTRTYWICQSIYLGYIKMNVISEILKDDITKEIANGVIRQWKAKQKSL
ncbi:MAG: hypothetical protein SPF56_00230 [Bacteroidaceae bacterium]|nr:hypothetical protein [Prevotellaceae bacterium]MDY5630928.1 hypothetical protein [Bacteroidaceae bacterium]